MSRWNTTTNTGARGEASGAAQRLGRRAFLRDATLILAAPALGAPLTAAAARAAETRPARLRLGLLTDVHHADKAPSGTRHYRDSRSKVHEAVTVFRRERVDALVELGDLVDAAPDRDRELAYLAEMEAELERLACPRHYVLGNHCVWTLTKEEFLAHSRAGGVGRTYYSFDRKGIHVVILDACFRADGVAYGRENFEWTDTEIPPEERRWLERDLAATERPTVVFTHQRLDVGGNYGVRSAPAVRAILEASRRVVAVFQGHSHQNEYREINGIHYTTLAAVVEGQGETNNAYAVADVFAAGSLRLEGFRRQDNRRFGRTAPSPGREF
jgi:alkaline phosphatase